MDFGTCLLLLGPLVVFMCGALLANSLWHKGVLGRIAGAAIAITMVGMAYGGVELAFDRRNPIGADYGVLIVAEFILGISIAVYYLRRKRK